MYERRPVKDARAPAIYPGFPVQIAPFAGAASVLMCAVSRTSMALARSKASRLSNPRGSSTCWELQLAGGDHGRTKKSSRGDHWARFVPSSSRFIRTIPMPRCTPFCHARKKAQAIGRRIWQSTSAIRSSRTCWPILRVDAVHINTPIPDHGPQSLAALRAGKHVACTVPMATTLDECRAIVEAQRASGKLYMMMETVVYSREFLFVKELYDTR